jgi:hypothetical protein
VRRVPAPQIGQVVDSGSFITTTLPGEATQSYFMTQATSDEG